MKFLTSRLFQLARSDVASYFIGYAFEYASSMIPVRRLYEDRTVMAFIHPVPFWTVHYLIVPKRRIPSFASIDLTDRQERDRILQILQTAQALARKSNLADYVVLVNGGDYQDVPQLHFHVASGGQKDDGEMYREKSVAEPGDDAAYKSGNAKATNHPLPARVFHQLIYCNDFTPSLWTADFFNPEHRQTIIDLLALAQELVQIHGLERYTLLANVHGTEPDGPLQFHLVSGDALG